jgi:transcriptional regulator with XRE-family HTH domain
LKTYEISFNTIVAVLLATIAEDFGVTHRQIAEYIGTSRSTVSKTLNGQIEISTNRLKFILLGIGYLTTSKTLVPDVIKVMQTANALESELLKSKVYNINVSYQTLDPDLDAIAIVKLQIEKDFDRDTSAPPVVRLRQCENL